MDKFLIKQKSIDLPEQEKLPHEVEIRESTSKTVKNIQLPANTDEVEFCKDSDEETTNKMCTSKRIQKFRPVWLAKFNWLVEKFGSKNIPQAYCRFCQVFLANNSTLFVRHENSSQHQKLVKSLKNQPSMDNLEKIQTFEKQKNSIKIAELRIIMFLIEHNLPFSLIKALIALIKVVAPDSQIAKELKCGKTKATETTNTILLEEGLGEIAEILRTQQFSLIIDETTDISTSKCLVLVVRYFDYIKGKVRDRFLALLKLNNSDSHSIYNVITDFFKNLNVPLEHLVGFASDNASVMMGKKSGVKALIQTQQPNVYFMGCICHSLHLCSSAASKKIPPNLESLTRNIYSFFAHSSKRQNELREFQEYFSVKNHKILKVASTRWLSIENVMKRILEQWIPLQHFFLSYEFERNADLAHNISSEMNDTNKTYFCFLTYVLNLINKINIEFQAEAPRIHILLPTITTYFKTIVQNFIKIDYYEKALTNQINFENDDVYLDLKDIYIGAKAEILLNTLEDQEKYKIKKNCQSYYVEICKQILNRIKFDDAVLLELRGINPESLTQSLVPLMTLFPNLVEEESLELLDEEWRCLINQTFFDTNLNFEQFWGNIFSLKNSLNEYMFPKIRKFIGTIIAFPHSSATAERKFSDVTLIKDKKRNSLLTSTVNSILMAKELLNDQETEKWIPSKLLISKYKKL